MFKGLIFMHSCGILLHISSLAGNYGIGTMGKAAYDFVDFLKKSGQEYWQILPVGPTGYGDSPYQSYSAYAGNPLLIDLDMLIEDGLISKDDHDLSILGQKHNFADYAQLYSFKNVILHKASGRFFAESSRAEIISFKKFCAENNFWLEDYALFMSLKYLFHQTMWTDWEDDIRLRKSDAVEKYTAELKDDILCWKFIQYEFFKQYFALKQYANHNGIKIYGDMPIYVSMDSSDIWANPDLFMLDENRRPTKVAGCPPDDFAPTGQLWGNPLYDWDIMEQLDYSWWISRVEYSSTLFDLTRIDHFRGFESFYAIPAEDKTAENGEWLKGPGMKLFKAIKAELGEVKLVAEDLGFLTDDVRQMLKEAGYPGMNVLEFAFYGGEDSSYLPHNYVRNSVTYIGTHDNDTAMGWYNSLGKADKKFAKKYMGLSKKEGVCAGLIRTAFASVSDLVIIQMQDYLGLGTDARMNIPSTIGNGNWAWRMHDGDLTPELSKKIRKYAKTYFRIPKAKKVKIKKNND
jgi:4-alpha-glucanotransferase